MKEMTFLDSRHMIGYLSSGYTCFHAYKCCTNASSPKYVNCGDLSFGGG